MDKEQLIQNYIANSLSDADKETVEKLLETDADFKLALESHKDVAMAYKIAEAQNLKATFRKLEQEKNKGRTHKFGISKIWYSAIASILVIGFFYIINNGKTGEDIFNSNFTIYPNTYQPVTRNTRENENSDAFVAYENKDFKNAELAFEEILKTSNDPNIRFYYAMALMNTSQLDIALEQLQQLSKDSYDYKPETLWYTALLYIQKEDYKSAKASLKALDRLNSTFKSEERKLILQKLED